MWRTIEAPFVLLCCCYVLLPVLTHETSFGKNFAFKRGNGFYDGNEYDDGFAEFTGGEKRTLSGMQRRRFQNRVEEDEAEVKRESIDDVLFRELTRREHIATETSDDTSQSDTFKDQVVDGVGTTGDDLALKEEEEKQENIKKRSYLPDDGDIFEGDIVMDQRLRSWITGEYDKRDAINDISYLWPKSDDGTVRVPYSLSDEIKEDTWKMKSIHQAIESFNKFTCVRFLLLDKSEDNLKREYGDGLDRVKLKINGSMCYSSVGRQGGEQDISIGNGCERVGTVIHEMMHSIGFIHEQSRPDRDDYIHVFYENIKDGMEHNFQKYSIGEVKNLPANKGFYDYDSCLHYNNHAFSKNSKDTIRSISQPYRRFGQRVSFSAHDILQINELYGCDVPNLRQKLQDIPYE